MSFIDEIKKANARKTTRETERRAGAVGAPAPQETADSSSTTGQDNSRVVGASNDPRSPNPATSYADSHFLDVARGYLQNSVPVFTMAPGTVGGPEFKFPRGWQTLVAQPGALDDWRPGWAVGAVCGCLFDVIDVDPRNGGDVSLKAIEEAGLLPPVYGEVQTPSGGRHLYIARTGFRKGSPAAGIDLQAGDKDGKGRGFVFITPTIRASKLDNQKKVYLTVQPIDWEGLRAGVGTPETKAWLDFLLNRLGTNWIEPPAAPAFEARDHTTHEQRYLEVTLQAVCEEVMSAGEGDRNNTLNRKAFYAGQLVAGCGLNAGSAQEALIRAGMSTGLPQRQVVFTVSRSLKQGMSRPLQVGPFSPEAQTRQALIDAAVQAKREFEAFWEPENYLNLASNA